MDENGVFNLSDLDRSLELNLSFDPTYVEDPFHNLDHDLDLGSENCDKKVDLLEEILQHYLKHNNTTVCLEDTLKLINMAKSSQIELPTTKYLFFKSIADRSTYNLQRFYYVKCSKCGIYSKRSSTKQSHKCDDCGKTLIARETNFFIYMPIEKQLIQCLQINWSLIQRYNFNLDYNVGINSLTDVHSANLLKKIYASYSKSEKNVISLTLNTDGANKFKSNTLSVWPIQIIQNFLPPEVRFKSKNILTVGLYYGENKPDCMQYFEPLVSEFKILCDRGLCVTIENEEYMFFPLITHCVVDLPAKRMLQCIKQYNGWNACTYCKHPGNQITILAKKKLAGKVTRKGIRYPSGDYAPRTDIETLRAMNEEIFDPDSDGIMALSCLVSLPKFKIITGFGIDYMHCVDLGIVRKIINFLVNPRYHKRPFYLSKKKLALLEKKLLSIKPISEINRKPKPIRNRSDYTANELRSILLYYFPVCLIGVVPSQYVQNFQQISSAIYILLKSSISDNDIVEADQKLRTFLQGYETLYGKFEMVMNVHLLTHIIESVKHLGPLWAQSAFPFERNNGVLLKSIRGCTDVLDQISSKYLLNKYLWKSHECKINNPITFIGRPNIIRDISLTLHEDCSEKCIKIKNGTFSAYRGIKINGIKYTSRLHKALKKSIDYFVGLKSGTFGIAKFYISHENRKFVCLEEYETMESIGHILDVEPTTVNIYAPVESIDKKYIYMKMNNKEYIACMPNNFENE